MLWLSSWRSCLQVNESDMQSRRWHWAMYDIYKSKLPIKSICIPNGLHDMHGLSTAVNQA
jgi:hypothetical protein